MQNELFVFEQVGLQELSPIFEKYGIPTSTYSTTTKYDQTFESRKTIPLAVDVLILSGFNPTQADLIVRGMKNDEGQRISNGLSSCYHAYIIQTVVNTYLSRKMQETRFEVGFDLAHFPPEKLIKQFSLDKRETAWETPRHRKLRKERNETEPTLLFDIYQDADGNYYTVRTGRLGQWEYMGFVFNNPETAFKFVSWCLRQPDFKIKDVALLSNRYGGLDLESIKAYEAELEFIHTMGGE